MSSTVFSCPVYHELHQKLFGLCNIVDSRQNLEERKLLKEIEIPCGFFL